jgi:hypothetical protein
MRGTHFETILLLPSKALVRRAAAMQGCPIELELWQTVPEEAKPGVEPLRRHGPDIFDSLFPPTLLTIGAVHPPF